MISKRPPLIAESTGRRAKAVWCLVSAWLYFVPVSGAQEEHSVRSLDPVNRELPGILASPLGVGRQSVPALTLAHVIEEARQRNPEIQAAKKRWEGERAKVGSERSWPDPQIGVEFWGTKETWYDVAQTVPFPGKQVLKAKAQAHEAKRQMGFYDAKEKEILARLKAAYYSYFLASRQIEIFQESVNVLERFSKVAESKYSVSKASEIDVLKAHVEYSKSLNTLVTMEQEKETAQAELNALLDRRPDFPLAEPEEPALADLDLAFSGLVDLALASRPEVHAARHHVNHMKAELWSKRADFLPDTMLQYSRREFDDSEMKDDNIFMVKFNVPFVWFWRQGSLVKAATKAKEEAEAELRAVETMTRLDVKVYLVKTQTARRLVELYRTSVIPQTEAALKVAQAGYESGTASFLDLLDSQRSWLEFQMEYYQYLAQFWSYLSALERVVGKDLVVKGRPSAGKQGEGRRAS